MNLPPNLICHTCLGFTGLLVAFLVLLWAYRQQQSWEREWVKFARRTGLIFEGKTLDQLSKEAQASRKFIQVGPPQLPPTIRGEWHGYPISIRHKKVYFDEMNYWFTVYRVRATFHPEWRLLIRKRISVSPFNRFEYPNLSREMRSDFNLPGSMRIRGQPTSFVRSVLQKPAVREQLEGIQSGFELRLEEQSLKLALQKRKIPAQQMEKYLELIVYLASLLSSP